MRIAAVLFIGATPGLALGYALLSAYLSEPNRAAADHSSSPSIPQGLDSASSGHDATYWAKAPESLAPAGSSSR